MTLMLQGQTILMVNFIFFSKQNEKKVALSVLMFQDNIGKVWI